MRTTMQLTVRMTAVAVTALGVGSVLGACSKASTSSTASSSSSASAPKTSTTSTTTAPSSSSSTSTSTSTSSTPASTTTATTTTCQPSQLTIVAAGSTGATGTIELTFSLTNSSTAVCTLSGYPGMQLLSSSGGALTTNVVRGGGLAFENVAVTGVSLASDQVAYFNLGYSDVVSGNETSCPPASEVEITPPNDTTYADVSVSSLDACEGGTLHLSPVFASTNSAALATAALSQP